MRGEKRQEGEREPRPRAGNRIATRNSDRGVSITLNYVLVLGISATLVAGLLVAGGSFVEDQRERVIEDEMNVVGNHIAGDIEQVDRMVRAGVTKPDQAVINQTFQRTVSGTTYNVELESSPDQVVLTSNSPSVTVEIPVTVQTDVRESFAFGGETSVQYDDSEDELVITDG